MRRAGRTVYVTCADNLKQGVPAFLRFRLETAAQNTRTGMQHHIDEQTLHEHTSLTSMIPWWAVGAHYIISVTVWGWIDRYIKH